MDITLCVLIVDGAELRLEAAGEEHPLLLGSDLEGFRVLVADPEAPLAVLEDDQAIAILGPTDDDLARRPPIREFLRTEPDRFLDVALEDMTDDMLSDLADLDYPFGGLDGAMPAGPVERPVISLPMPDWNVFDQYRGDFADDVLAEILDSPHDLLADVVLAAGEPDLPSVRAQMPPLLDRAFLADARIMQRPVINQDGQIEGYWEVPLDADSPCRMAALPSAAVIIAHRTASGGSQLAFALPGPHGECVVWLRRQAPGQDQCEYFCCQPGVTGVEPTEFYQALLTAIADTYCPIPVQVPEPELQQAARRSLQLGLLTFRGLAPHYGMGSYDKKMHHAFPPTTISAVEALLAIGDIPEAADRITYYLSRYVNPDGSLDYYGPSVAEHGQLLSLAARVAANLGGPAFIKDHLALVRPVWRRLLDIRKRTIDIYHNASDPRHGLIPGLPEADYHQHRAQWDEFYYAGDLWVCRGLREWGRLLFNTSLAACKQEGYTLLQEADAYHADIIKSLRKVGAFDGDFLPPGPTQLEPIDDMVSDAHSSYCNYRYLPEMLSSGELPEKLMCKGIEWRRTHRGELLRTIRFKDHLDDWPVLHYARALLELDMIDDYLLLMYAHLAHHQDAGTQVAYEQVDIKTEDGARRRRAGQVAPCQFTVPTMLAWALAYDDRDGETLWLMRGTPKRWWDTPGAISGPLVFVNGFSMLDWRIDVRDDGAVLTIDSELERINRIVLRTRGKKIANVDVSDTELDEIRITDDREALILSGDLDMLQADILWA